MTDARSILSEFLANTDARCPACRYALRGCTSDKCPECGCELTLGVVAAQLLRAPMWWFAALYGCTVSAILSLVILIGLMDRVVGVLHDPHIAAMVSGGFASRGDLPRWPAIFSMLAICAAAGLLLAWVIRRRQDFTRWPAFVQIAIGAACWLSPLAIFGVIAQTTR